MTTIKMKLDPDSIDGAIKKLNQYEKKLKRRCTTLARRLCEMGAQKVVIDYSTAQYSGDKNIEVSVRKRKNGYAIVASGGAVLFVEFGAGIKYAGDVHPQAGDFHYGAGTYPGKGHWSDPQGWWYPAQAGEGVTTTKAGTQYAHTYGNPPSMTMYNADQYLIKRVEAVAREVFSK